MIIRKQPTDFLVHERTSAGWDAQLQLLRPINADEDRAAFAVYEVCKTSMTTPDAASHLARAIGSRVQEVSYAGLKDKHAQTTQLMTVKLARDAKLASLPREVALGNHKSDVQAVTHASDAVQQAESAQRGLTESGSSDKTIQPTAMTPVQQSKNISHATLIGSATRAIEAADIASNAFRITIRDMQRSDYALFLSRLDLLAVGAEQKSAVVFANYFGDQRFGSARHGKGFAAEYLLKGDFESALKLLIAIPDRKDTGVQRTFTRELIANWGDWKKLATKLPRTPNRKAIETLAACPQPPTQDHFRQAFASLPFALQELAVDAYQSQLWNAQLAARMKASELTAHTASTLVVESDYGQQVYPAPTPQTLARLTLALPASEARIPGLRRPAFATGERACSVLARNVTLSEFDRDLLCTRPKPRGACVLTCELPSGSYVTTMLRSLGQS